MNNIFENAYFGKPYKTRDGRKALLWYYHVGSGIIDQAVLITTYKHQILVDGNGKEMNEPYHETINDIVSEWKEPIDEYELSELACNCAGSMDIPCIYKEAVIEGFKAGYRKAKEDKL